MVNKYTEQSELQNRADRADQLVLFFLAGANFWEKHAKNCAIMSMAHITMANKADSVVTKRLRQEEPALPFFS